MCSETVNMDPTETDDDPITSSIGSRQNAANNLQRLPLPSSVGGRLQFNQFALGSTFT